MVRPISRPACSRTKLAVARCRGGGLKRLIWLPQGTGSEDDRQRKFIAALHARRGSSVRRGPDRGRHRGAEGRDPRHLEEDRAAGTEATGARRRPASSLPLESSAKLIYFICDEKDRKASVPVRKLCRQLGFEVALPAFEGDASEVRKSNQQNLASCDVVVVFYGAGDEAWKRTIDNELKKMAGYRGGKLPPASVRLTWPSRERTTSRT